MELVAEQGFKPKQSDLAHLILVYLALVSVDYGTVPRTWSYFLSFFAAIMAQHSLSLVLKLSNNCIMNCLIHR